MHNKTSAQVVVNQSWCRRTYTLHGIAVEKGGISGSGPHTCLPCAYLVYPYLEVNHDKA